MRAKMKTGNNDRFRSKINVMALEKT